jgi:hypothetical protein
MRRFCGQQKKHRLAGDVEIGHGITSSWFECAGRGGRMRGIGREWIVGPALVALMGVGVLFF